ncbi:MAG: hypothetical protein AB1750_18770 [Chloroflexota bacterium]
MQEKPLSKFLKFVFWFVVVNSTLGALSLILFPTKTETFFFWKIAPPVNAMLVGTMYLVAGVAVGYAAVRGTWESARVIAAMGFSLSVLLLAATLIHVDRFVPGIKLDYWLFVYFIFPVLVALLYWRYEKGGANWQAVNREIKPLTRLTALTAGLGMAIFALVGFFFPSLIIPIWPWPLSELMVRVFVSWLTALSVSNLWFLVEKEWTRVQMVAYMLIATPLVVAGMMLVNRADLTGGPAAMTGFGVALALLACAGAFMLWNQRRA